MKHVISTLFFLLPITLFAQYQLRIEGGYLNIANNTDLVLHNAKLVNNANFTAGNSTVYFTGDAAATMTTIEGTNPTTFHQLAIKKTTNNVLLNNDISVQNGLLLQGQQLDIQGFNLTLGNTSYITTSTNNNYILTSGMGTVNRQIPSGLAITFPIGFGATANKLVIQNDGTSDIYSVRVSDEVLEDGNTGTAYTSEAVNRTWWIDEATAGGSDLTITTSWETANELASFDRTNCFLSHYENGSWDEVAHGTATGNNPWTITRSGVTSLSPFAVFSGNVLPVELLDFRAKLENKNVLITWETTNEINNSHFEMEHSINGQIFQNIGRIEAAFPPTELNFYNLEHTAPAFGLNYYRLKQVDLDGAFSYSPIRVVRLDERAQEVFVYPNPASHLLHFNQAISGEYRLLNSIGQVLQKGQFDTASFLEVAHLPSGNYYLQVIDNQSNRLVFPFIKMAH